MADPLQEENSLAASANKEAYGSGLALSYTDGAPHLKHKQLRQLFLNEVSRVWDIVRHSERRSVLDLGAGEGTATEAFLSFGASVCAVDLSTHQLEALSRRCARLGAGTLDVQNRDIHEYLASTEAVFDVVVMNSLLHHIPDYLSLLKAAAARVAPRGVIFTFQDPILYSSMPLVSRMVSEAGYLSWRVGQGDILGGVSRRIRRSFGIYRSDSYHDNAEYHVTRGGVDSRAIAALLNNLGFDCEVRQYFSAQNGFFQALGSRVGMSNTFGVVAVRRRSQLASN